MCQPSQVEDIIIISLYLVLRRKYSDKLVPFNASVSSYIVSDLMRYHRILMVVAIVFLVSVLSLCVLVLFVLLHRSLVFPDYF